MRWVKAWHTTGTTHAKRQGGDKRSHRIEAYRAVILVGIEAQVDITLVELAEMLRREHGAGFAPSMVWRFLDRHNITVKKAAHATEQQRPDVAGRREAWFDAQPDLDPAHLVFIDETRTTTKGHPAKDRRTHNPRPPGCHLRRTPAVHA